MNSNWISVSLVLLLFFLSSSINCQDFFPNPPVFGIISIPSDLESYPSDKWSYFPSSYVKFLQSGGAQVVPIKWDLPKKDIKYLLDNVNGILFTGGGTVFADEHGNVLPVAKSFEFILNYAIELNLNGNYFPVWGTCQGFEVFTMILGRNYSILTHCVGCIDVQKNNIFETSYQSKLFRELPEHLRQKMGNGNLSEFWEDWKLDINAFEKNPFLSNYLLPVTYTFDAAGTKYVSSLESPYLPIYATQFHQEMSTYEWIGNKANHGEDAVALQQYLSNFIVSEARKNKNVFLEKDKYLIENFNVTIDVDQEFTSIYLFPLLNSTQVVTSCYE